MTLAKPLKNSKGLIRNSTLILLAFSTAFFSRILDSSGAPSAINFLHFVAIPYACGMALIKSRTRNQHQITIVWSILAGLLILLSVMLASAIFNNAGEINVVLDFLLLGEPFLLLLALISLPMTSISLGNFRTWLIRFGFINLFFAGVQYVLFMVLGLHPKAGNPDYVQGVFYHSGAGHVVSASVSLTFGVYYFLSAKKVPLWIRTAVVSATFLHMLLADAKQVLLSFAIAWALLFLTKFKNIFEAMKYVVPALLLAFIFLWSVQNVPAFGAFQTWARPDIYGSDGEATLLKTAALRIIPTYFTSPLNWVLGLGPGHTVGRLGGWMIDNYWDMLSPLGATKHPASGAVWNAVGQSWLGNQSSMFSPLFGWAGIWGDLGFLGLGAYFYLGFVVWRYLCKDDFTKFLLFTVFVFGLVFSQMEEPGYMLFIAIIIGLKWHENRVKISGR